MIISPLYDEQWMAASRCDAWTVRDVVSHPNSVNPFWSGSVVGGLAGALWDCWIHERDVILPLGIEPAIEPDEVSSCSRFAAAIGPALALGVATAQTGIYAVEATDPETQFVMEVADTVVVRLATIDDSMPVLRGDAVELIEALSLRRPMPATAPAEWVQLLVGLTAAFS